MVVLSKQYLCRLFNIESKGLERKSLVFKNTCCFSRGHQFESYHLNGSLQPSLTPVPVYLTPSSGLWGYTYGTQICIQAKQPYTYIHTAKQANNNNQYYNNNRKQRKRTFCFRKKQVKHVLCKRNVFLFLGFWSFHLNRILI